MIENEQRETEQKLKVDKPKSNLKLDNSLFEKTSFFAPTDLWSWVLGVVVFLFGVYRIFMKLIQNIMNTHDEPDSAMVNASKREKDRQKEKSKKTK